MANLLSYSGTRNSFPIKEDEIFGNNRFRIFPPIRAATVRER